MTLMRVDLLKKILHITLDTEPVEIDCSECQDQVAQLVEMVVASKGVPEALRLLEEHLARCNDCNEEYQALLSALRVLDENRQAP